MQLLAIALQQRLAQESAANLSDAHEVQRTNSSKVPWLVIGPNGVELAVAHKIRVFPVANNTEQHPAKPTLVRLLLETLVAVTLFVLLPLQQLF